MPRQGNNSYIFPGVGLGVIAVRARRLTDTMFMAAAKALAALSPARNDTGSNLLPPVTALREVSIAVARATAFQARKEGLTYQLAASRPALGRIGDPPLPGRGRDSGHRP